MKTEETTHFGHEEVAAKDKPARVNAVFDSVVDKYDLMNDLMSFGLHRLWKCLTIEHTRVKPGQHVLDLASGTGDLARRLAKRVGPLGRVVSADINHNMLEKGRDRLIDHGLINNVMYTQADAQALPFNDNSFDVVTMAFGLRNVTHKNKALDSIWRVLKPGGKLVVLEFSEPKWPGLKTLYNTYSSIIPSIGKWVVKDEASYRYLIESIQRHPDQLRLKEMLVEAGFEQVSFNNFSGGIVALHYGFKC